MGSEESHQTVQKNPPRVTRTHRQAPPNYHNPYPGIYPPATNEYPPYPYNYPPQYYGDYYQNQYYPPPQMVPDEFSKPKRSHHHRHKHDRRELRNQQQQTQQNVREYGAQTTPSLFLGENNPDEIPRSTPTMLRRSPSNKSLDENSLNDEVDLMPSNSPIQPSLMSPHKRPSESVIHKKVLSPNANRQQRSIPVNPYRSTPAVYPKFATSAMNNK